MAITFTTGMYYLSEGVMGLTSTTDYTMQCARRDRPEPGELHGRGNARVCGGDTFAASRFRTARAESAYRERPRFR